LTAWKEHEKRVAKKLGGRRVSRGADFSLSAPDVIHDRFSVECKYRKRLGQFLHDAIKQAEGYDPDKIPIAVLKEHHQRGEYVLIRLDDFLEVLK